MRKLLTFLIALAAIVFAVGSPVSAQGFIAHVEG
jgi:cytochrome c oxidase assembly factor CtaG